MAGVVEVAKELYKAFASQKAEKVFAVVCCGRVYLGINPATRCRTCTSTPKNVEICTAADLDNLGRL